MNNKHRFSPLGERTTEKFNEMDCGVSGEFGDHPPKNVIGGIELEFRYSDDVGIVNTTIYSDQITPGFIEAMEIVNFEHFPPSGYELRIGVGGLGKDIRNFEDLREVAEIIRKNDLFEKFKNEHPCAGDLSRTYETVDVPLPDLPPPEVYDSATGAIAYPGYQKHGGSAGWGNHEGDEETSYLPLQITWYRDEDRAEKSILGAKEDVRQYDGELCSRRIRDALKPYRGEFGLPKGLLRVDNDIYKRISAIDICQARYSDIKGSKDIDSMIKSAREFEDLLPKYVEALERKAVFDKEREEKLSKGGILVDFTPEKNGYCRAWVVKPDGTESPCSQKRETRYAQLKDYWPIVREDEFAFAWDQKNQVMVDVKLPVGDLTPEQQEAKTRHEGKYFARDVNTSNLSASVPAVANISWQIEEDAAPRKERPEPGDKELFDANNYPKFGDMDEEEIFEELANNQACIDHILLGYPDINSNTGDIAEIKLRLDESEKDLAQAIEKKDTSSEQSGKLKALVEEIRKRRDAFKKRYKEMQVRENIFEIPRKQLAVLYKRQSDIDGYFTK